MGNIDNSKSEARVKNGPIPYKASSQIGAGVASVGAGNGYSAENNPVMTQPVVNGIQSQGNSYNSRAALNSQLGPNAQGNSQSEQSLKNLLPMNKAQSG